LRAPVREGEGERERERELEREAFRMVTCMCHSHTHMSNTLSTLAGGHLHNKPETGERAKFEGGIAFGGIRILTDLNFQKEMICAERGGRVTVPSVWVISTTSKFGQDTGPETSVNIFNELCGAITISRE